MYEEIAAFIRQERAQIDADTEWQEGYDPNDDNARGVLDGRADTLDYLADHFGIPRD